MGVLKLSGNLSAGPQSASEGFPAAMFSAPIFPRENQRSFGVATGIVTRQLASPGAFAALQGVGATDTVKNGDFLYMKSNAQIDVRMTIDNGAGGSDLRIVTVHGLVILEFSTARPLKLLEAQGTAVLEYFVSGQS